MHSNVAVIWIYSEPQISELTDTLLLPLQAPKAPPAKVVKKAVGGKAKKAPTVADPLFPSKAKSSRVGGDIRVRAWICCF